jgi:GNAT superfamily N-acetyltransferase
VSAADAQLARRCLVSVLKETARRCGGVSREESGLVLVAGTHPCPVIVNSALRTGQMDAAEVLRRAAKFFGERRHSYELWTRDGIDKDLETAALDSGMQFGVALTAMIAAHCPPPPTLVPGVAIQPVTDSNGARDFIAVVADGFQDEAPGMPELVRSTFADPTSLLAADTAAFVVASNGEPAAAAMTMVREGVAWIGWVATRADFRGRGLGGIATAVATRAGFSLGGSFASLEATTAGRSVYTKLGYHATAEYRNYWPAR